MNERIRLRLMLATFVIVLYLVVAATGSLLGAEEKQETIPPEITHHLTAPEYALSVTEGDGHQSIVKDHGRDNVDMSRSASSNALAVKDVGDTYFPEQAIKLRLQNGEPHYDYIIITTNHIRDNAAELPNFIAHKTDMGFSVKVVTEDDFGSLTGPYPNGRTVNRGRS